MAAAAAMLAAFACAPEILTPEQGKLPEASALTEVIEIDQTTNMVTFSVAEKGLVSVWIFGEEKIDGKASKKYAYTGNGLTLRFREAGVHNVELKAYNAHGLSIGSKTVSFTLDNIYRDPFDPAPYMKKMAGEWQWDSEHDGHFGCGPKLSEPAGWWSAKANEKADWSLYNDRMTFTEDGQYTFNPGKDGKVYVNAGLTSMGGPQNEDFLVDIPEYTTTYTVSNNWNEAGIEEIWLSLPSQKNLSYIPNDQIYNDPRFLVMESSKKVLKLAAAEAPNGDEKISWLYSFIPSVKVATPEELLAGTDGKGKAWVMDAEAKGHLGCGESPENPANWWSAGPHEKDGFGMYDDEITFYPDGKYVYSAGADGKMYINWGVTVIGPNNGAEPDVDIDWTTTESTYTFDGENLVLAANTPMVYVPSDAMYENPVFKVTSITETSLVVVAMNEGCYWQMIFRPRDYVAPAQSIAGVPVEGGKVDLTLTKGQAVDVVGIEMKSVDSDYFSGEGNSLKFIAPDGDYRIYVQEGYLKVIPLTDGEAARFPETMWIIGEGAGKPQGYAPGWVTGETADIPFVKDGNKYTATIYCTDKTNIKLFGQADWGVEWTKDRYVSFNGNGFVDMPADDGNIHAASGLQEGWYVFTAVDTDGEGALELTVTQKKETVWDPAAASNLWLGMTVEELFWYYAPAWAQIANPELEQDGNKYSFSLPEATAEQWQAQFAFKTDISTSAAKRYDFSCTVLLNTDHPGVTIKLVQTSDDKVFYCADRHAVTADEEFVYRLEGVDGIDMEKVSLFFDFGGNVAGTDVIIKDILLQEHID